MDRRAKPKKGNAEAKRPLARTSPKVPSGNVRDLEKRLAEAVEQQKATSEILRVIAASRELQPVLDVIALRAATLCAADIGGVTPVEDGLFKVGGNYGFPEAVARSFPRPVDTSTVTGRAVLERRIIHVPDFDAPDAPDSAVIRGLRRAPPAPGTRHFRSLLSVPMLRGDEAVGAMVLARYEPKAFSEAQIELMKTFADQAVIAIENVRLFTELEARNRDLTATSEILHVISRSPTDVQPVFEAIAEAALRLCEAKQGNVFLFDGELIHLAAFANVDPEASAVVRQAFPRPPDRATASSRAILIRNVVEIPDVLDDPDYQLTGMAAIARFRGCLSVPLLRGYDPIGAITVTRPQPGAFSAKVVALLQTFADQAVIAIENVRLFTELGASNRHLTEALEQQTATAEILRVISGTPTDAQPVFDTIVRNAGRVCDAVDGTLVLRQDDGLTVVAHWGPIGGTLGMQVPLTRGSVMGRAVIDAQPIHIEDLQSASEFPEGREFAVRWGHRTTLGVPLLREGDALGALLIRRTEVRLFSDAQIAMLQTFADQAVIAIENVRLFRELEAANRGLAAASQHKSEFLANMSHELRTPLNAIIGYSEMLQEEAQDRNQDAFIPDLEKINAAAKHQLSLINDILDLSKIEAGRMELEPTDFDLPSTIDNALSLVRERAARRSIVLGQAIDGRVGLIHGDERKVKQVLLNLLSNALKFTPEGGRIEVRATANEGLVEVSVADTGVGIAPEDQEAVFEEFRQVGTADRKVEGTGLGLALCRRFVDLHGGTISVKSQVGQGSTFSFTLPIRQEVVR